MYFLYRLKAGYMPGFPYSAAVSGAGFLSARKTYLALTFAGSQLP